MKDKEKEIREFINHQMSIIDELKTEQLRYNALFSISFLEGEVATKKLLQVFSEDESEELRGNALDMVQKGCLGMGDETCIECMKQGRSTPIPDNLRKIIEFY